VKIQEKVDIQNIMQSDDNWTKQTLALGVLIGALTGLGGAYLLIQHSKKKDQRPTLSSKEGLRLGLLIFGLLRQIQLLGEDE
jgi:hypothetical protein